MLIPITSAFVDLITIHLFLMAFIANIKTSSFLVLICFLTFSLHTTTTEACHKTDKAALLDFKSKITLDPAELLKTWNKSTDCCTKWEGVACGSNGRVVNLSRSGIFSPILDDFAFMAGTISPSLGRLTFLRLLDFNNLKSLTGTIPTELGKLSHLTTLFLNSNQLKGSIPASFQNLRKLNRLFLNDNLLSGTVPTNIFRHMSSLTELDFSENQLSGGIPSSIDKLVSLKRLELHHNNFSGSIPSTIGNLKNLAYLILSNNQISGSLPSSMSKLVLLNSCYLQDNKLTGSIPALIGGSALQFLVLDNNMLTGRLPKSFGSLTNLLGLFVRNNRLKGKIPSSFSNLRNLQYLGLSRNGLSGPIPSELVKLNATLKTLDLSFNPLSLVNIPIWISKMTLLQLHLARTGLIGELPEWLSDLSSDDLSANSFLNSLDLSSNMLSGVLPAWIGKMASLSSLNLSNNGFHSAIPVEIMNLSILRILDLHLNNFTGGLRPIFGDGLSLSWYSYIDLSYNMFVGRIDNFANLGNMESLETLVLSNNRLGGSIPESLGKLRQLRTLKVAKNGFAGSIPSGVINLVSLREFDVSYNKLTGKIPSHTTPFPSSSFKGNSGLCDSPLPPCETA
ncbi:probable leucine-rich repeat receptor-like protein kinase At1g35710 [Papaver somniferum]|nr:probable leucine-rich repeat receptor-like protein kinase At1g35710 [Papaver somniferum]